MSIYFSGSGTFCLDFAPLGWDDLIWLTLDAFLYKGGTYSVPSCSVLLLFLPVPIVVSSSGRSGVSHLCFSMRADILAFSRASLFASFSFSFASTSDFWLSQWLIFWFFFVFF